MDRQQKAHLVLGAGGVGGLTYIGAYKALSAHGFQFQSVSGISAGSYFAALIAAGFSPEEMEALALKTDLKKLRGRRVFPPPFGFLNYFRWPFAPFKAPRLPEIFREVMGGDPRFKDLDLFYQTLGVDVANNRILIYSKETHPEMRVSEAIHISTSIPFLHPPHENKGRIVVDPAVISYCPLWLAARFADPFPIIGFYAKFDRSRRRYLTPVQYLTDLLQSSAESHDYYYSKQISRAHLLPVNCYPYKPLDFSLKEKDVYTLIQKGSNSVEDFLPRLRAWSQMEQQKEAAPVSSSQDQDDIAEQYGEAAFKALSEQEGQLQRDQIFISYSPEDRKWLEALKKFISPYIRYREWQVWDESKVSPGDTWAHQVTKALLRARVAVLLVTPNYLANEFISETQLPYLLKVAEEEKVRLLWIAVSQSNYQLTELKELMPANDPEQPLDRFNENEKYEELKRISLKIEEAYQSV